MICVTAATSNGEQNTVGTFHHAAGGSPTSSRPDGRLARRPEHRPITALRVRSAAATAAGCNPFD